MKEQIAILPHLPVVGTLKLSSLDGKSISLIEVVRRQKSSLPTPLFKDCYEQLQAYLSGKTKKINIPLDYSALSPFQFKVLKEMAKIPYGEVATYKDLAESIKSKAYQAVGSACGKNPFMLIYPCHRIVGSTDLGGFAHGIIMKKALLELEGFILPN